MGLYIDTLDIPRSMSMKILYFNDFKEHLNIYLHPQREGDHLYIVYLF